MRPDEHKRKKSQAYKKKHGISTAASKQNSEELATAQYAKQGSAGSSTHEQQPRVYDLPVVDETQVADYRSLSDHVVSVSSHPKFSDEDTSMQSSLLPTFSNGHIEAALECVPLHRLLGMDSREFKLLGCVDDTAKAEENMQAYERDILDHDGCIVDHLKSKTVHNVQTEDILLKNTGQEKLISKNTPLIDTSTVTSHDEKLSDNLKKTDDISDSQTDDLEDWLDSVLDD